MTVIKMFPAMNTRRPRLTDKRIMGLLLMASKVRNDDLSPRRKLDLFNRWTAAEKREIRTALAWLRVEAKRRGLEVPE